MHLGILLQRQLQRPVQMISRLLRSLDRLYARLIYEIAKLYRENTALDGTSPYLM